MGGVGHIPWRDIVEYADRAGLDVGMSQVFLHVIRRLDDDYLEQTAKSRPRNPATTRTDNQ